MTHFLVAEESGMTSRLVQAEDAQTAAEEYARTQLSLDVLLGSGTTLDVSEVTNHKEFKVVLGVDSEGEVLLDVGES